MVHLFNIKSTSHKPFSLSPPVLLLLLRALLLLLPLVPLLLFAHCFFFLVLLVGGSWLTVLLLLRWVIFFEVSCYSFPLYVDFLLLIFWMIVCFRCWCCWNWFDVVIWSTAEEKNDVFLEEKTHTVW